MLLLKGFVIACIKFKTFKFKVINIIFKYTKYKINNCNILLAHDYRNEVHINDIVLVKYNYNISKFKKGNLLKIF